MRIWKWFVREGQLGSPPVQNRRIFPALETLEERCTPALFSGYSHVNTTTALRQYEPVTASSPNGNHVVVWTHEYNSSDFGIHAQIYNSSGDKVGGEIVVANTSVRELYPSVCMDGNGGFYVAYARLTTFSNSDVLVTRVNPSGIVQGTTVVANSTKQEYNPRIACSRYGSFVVTYTYETSSSNQDIRASLFSSSGTLQKSFVVAASASRETQAAVARNLSATNGDFSIAYVVNYKDVYLRRYNGSGTFLGTYNVATTTSTETTPAVAMDYNRNTVVSFQRYMGGSNWNIYARKVYSNGVLSPTWAINTSSNKETDVSIAIDYNDGDFVVSYLQTVAGNFSVVQSEVTTTGKVRSTYLVSSSTYNYKPSVSILGLNQFFTVYTLSDSTEDPWGGIFGRRGIL